MTATITPYRSATAAGPRGGLTGFGRLVRAEATKFRTVRGWVLGLGAAAVAIVLVGLLGTGAGRQDHGGAPRLPAGPGGEAVNDNFYFLHQALTGNGSITVPLTSLTGLIEVGPDGDQAGIAPWAKAGLILKRNLDQGSAYAAIMATGSHGVRMQDNYTHDVPAVADRTSTATPRWLRLVRSGDLVTGYTGNDGSRWTRVSAARLNGLPATVQVGLFAASPEFRDDADRGAAYTPAVAIGAFGPVSLAGGWSRTQEQIRTAWRGEQFGGDAGLSGSYSGSLSGGYTSTATGFTLTGAGDIAPVVGGTGPGFTLENLLVGGFAGLIVVIVLGAGFITGEYRTGLIATSLAASPRRGRLLLAKVVVLGSVTFGIGLLASALAVTLGRIQARAHGFPVIGVPAGTGVRVVVGTALLLSLGSVLALAVGALLRRAALAVMLVVAALILPYLLALSSILPTGPSDWLLRLTPAAGFAIQQSLGRYEQVDTLYSPLSGYYPLAPWAGFGVLCGYTALALAAAVLVIRRRDA
jgi:ABC-type transport system involved in multi-copper enzyme maturation permease subunit